MAAFLIRRLFSLVVVLLCVVTITFVLVRISPGGDPFEGEKAMPEEVRQEKLVQYKLDGPIWWQYARYLGDILRGDFRESFKYKNRTVQEILAQALPVSFVLGGLAFVLATTGGVLLGTLAALRRNTWVDYSAMFFALLAISLPSFVTGPLVIMVFAIWLGWFPVGGWMEASSVVLPAIVLAAPFVAYIARLMRNSMLDVLQQDFMRTARAKGLSRAQALYRHGLKVAILPVVTFLGPLAAHLLTGSIVVETIFSIPGAGGFFIRSIENRDGVLLCGVVVVYCALLVAFNFLVDVAYSFLDRRIKLYAEPA